MPDFLGLPFEIRFLIYQFHFSSLRLELEQAFYENKCAVRYVHDGFPFDNAHSGILYKRGLALANRQLYEEVSELEAQSTEVVISGHSTRICLTESVPQTFLQGVRRLHINTQRTDHLPARTLMYGLTPLLPRLEVARWEPRFSDLNMDKLKRLGLRSFVDAFHNGRAHSSLESIQAIRDYLTPAGDMEQLSEALLRWAKIVEEPVRGIATRSYSFEIMSGVVPFAEPINHKVQKFATVSECLWSALIIFGPAGDARVTITPTQRLASN